MTDRNKVILLPLIVTGLVLFATALSLLLSYRTAVEQERERPLEAARSEARLIEVMYSHEQQLAAEPGAMPGDPAAATLNQLSAAHARFAGFGETGEYTLGLLENQQIVFLSATVISTWRIRACSRMGFWPNRCAGRSPGIREPWWASTTGENRSWRPTSRSPGRAGGWW